MSNETLFLWQVLQFSAAAIFLWAMFCVFAKRVNDGIVGKIMFSMLGFAAFAVVLAPGNARALVIMVMFVAFVGIRHMWMKCFWLHIKLACERWLICEKFRQWKTQPNEQSLSLNIRSDRDDTTH
ncbi:MAG TPA: hypothetical protein VK974_04645 [Methylophilaceae bacterium]|nr:hypothetical protein [Methylophilaceae bacterium]